MQWMGGGKLQSPLPRAMTIPGSDGAMEDCQTLSRRSLLLQAASLLVLSVATVPRPAAALGLPKSLPKATVQQMKEEARRDVKAVLGQLNKDVPGVVNSVAATAGGGALGAGLMSLPALWFGGSVTGLSAAGITTGLSAAGGGVAAALGALGVTVVSPMVAGVAVLAVPVLAGGASLGWVANKIKARGTKPVEKLEYAIQELKTIEARLKPRRHFRSEIAEIKSYVKEFEGQKSRLA